MIGTGPKKPVLEAACGLILSAFCSQFGFAASAGSGDHTSAVNSKGYDRESVYLSLDGPEINAFNLNFVVQFPLAVGLNYPENAGVGLQLNLTYNSRVANYQNRGVAAAFHRYVRVRRQNPFGLGFDVSLGKIIKHAKSESGRYLYVDASGASHGLALFATSPSGSEYRTHDGSHIRAVLSNDNTEWTVSFPSGLVQELGHRISDLGHNPSIPAQNDLHWGTTIDQTSTTSKDFCDVTEGGECTLEFFIPDPVGGQNGLDWSGFDRDFVGWHVTSVYSRTALSSAPPSYTVEYFGDDGNPADARFAHIIRFIRDQHGRVIEFLLDRQHGTVSSILTPAPGTSSGPRAPAQYDLEYGSVALSVLGQTHTARVLTRLWSPNVASSGTERYLHAFGYKPGGGGDFGGQMSRVDYPSGRATLISYQRYSYLNGSQGYCMGTGSGTGDPDECNAMTNGGTCAWSWGVSSIESFLDGNTANTAGSNKRTTTLSQATTYRDYKFFGAAGCSGAPPEGDDRAGYKRYDQIHTMIDPGGNKTEFRYRTPQEDDELNLYGLLVNEKYYLGTANGKLLKEIDYDYEKLDEYAWTVHDQEFEMATDQIITTWLDDHIIDTNTPVSTVLQEDRTDFDDFGHYQRSELSGSAIGTKRKVVIKDYAADNRQYVNGPLCSTATALQNNWLGDVVKREDVLEKVGATETIVSRSVYGYDTTRGTRTTEVRQLDPTDAVAPCADIPFIHANDHQTFYAFTDAGDLASERHYIPGLASTSVPNDVTTTYTYSHGARESAKNSALSYYDYFRTIDPDSGLTLAEKAYPLSASDSTAVSTTFEYDVLGRTTNVRHGTDDAATITYENEGFTSDPIRPSPAVRLLKVKSTQGTLYAQTESVDWFKFGRLDKEEKLNPDWSRAYRYRTYDSMERVYFVSEWTRQTTITGVPGTTMDHSVYDQSNGSVYGQDPFGRVTVLTDALGNQTEYEYFGLNKRVWSHNVALKSGTLGATWDVATTYYTDALGRLRVVSKPVASSATDIDEGAGGEYSYDVLGRLLQADISGNVTVSATSADRYNATTSSPQTRTFVYDALGHLTTSTTPESGTVSNLAWNALDQVTETQDALGSAWGHKHRTTYDGAGRPTRVERVKTSGPTINLAYGAGDEAWDTHGTAWRYDSPGTCLKQANGSNQPSWYIGSTSCQYATSAATGPLDLDSPEILLPHGAIVAFKYFREVRDEVGMAGNHDRFSVKIQDQTITHGPWQEVFFLDSSQTTWPKWVWSPAISLDAWAGKTVKIRFEFDSVTQNTGSPVLRGIGISDVSIRRSAAVTLQETYYDETGGNPANKALGKATTIKDYDEATGMPIFTQELHYVDPNARLSDRVLRFDWDRDGVPQALYDAYRYDSRGDISSQWMPNVEGSTRRYDYWRRHGAITAITAENDGTGSAFQAIIPGDVANGIEYNDAGGMSKIQFQNGLQQHIEPNADFLPNRIWVDRGEGFDPIWDTQQYSYDGARNIKQIGEDYYRYDAAMRLTWARETSNIYNTVDLDQTYDPFGNMLSQTATRSGGGTNALPYGLTFSGRSYTNNKITSTPGFAYDSNGNLIAEPDHDNLSGQHYSFTPENELSRITADSLPGATAQAAMYEGGDHRWFRSEWGDGSKALLTLRDASGRVVADFKESNASDGLKLQREYIHANGQLIAINSTCGPRPALKLANPATVGGSVWFDKTDHVGATGGYTLHIRTSAGQIKTLSLPWNVGNPFSIPQSELFPNVQNWIQIEAEAECGSTGYSNAVTYSYDPNAPSCLKSIGGARAEFSGSGSKLVVRAQGSCTPTTTYNVYYSDPDSEEQGLAPLNGSTPVADPSQLLENLPCGSGNGNYWIRPVSSVTHHEMASSPVMTMDGTSCGGESNAIPAFMPGQPSMNLQYLHWDHLGSTRMLTDERGVPIAKFKYYPFGHEAEFTGGSELRQKFTGHERDERVGLDYMLARYYSSSLSRFLSTDPLVDSARPGSPQTWNRYAYAFNNPIRYNDPNGEDGNDVANWIDRQVDAAVSFVDANTNEGTLTTPLNDAATAAGALISGAADMLRVGAATGEAIGSGQSGTDMVGAVSQDVARGAAMFVTLGAPAAGAVSGGEAAATSSGTKITGFTKEGINQTINRGVKPAEMLDATKSPIKQVTKTDAQGRVSTQNIGKKATVVTNPQGKVVTTWKTSTKRVEKIEKKQ